MLIHLNVLFHNFQYCIFFNGICLLYLTGLLKQILQWAQRYHGGIYRLWIGPLYPFVIMYKPELIEVSRAVTISLSHVNVLILELLVIMFMTTKV